jgi:hypothetical protein
MWGMIAPRNALRLRRFVMTKQDHPSTVDRTREEDENVRANGNARPQDAHRGKSLPKFNLAQDPYLARVSIIRREILFS